MKIAVSFLKSDDYENCIKLINESSADFLHVDMCDGLYVRAKNFEIDSLIELLKCSIKPLNVHMLVKNPIMYVDKIASLNTDMIIFHPLATSDVVGTIEYIKSKGIKVGLAINPNEKTSLIENYIDLVDAVLIMSVHPGKGGQKFIDKVLYKIDEIRTRNGKVMMLIDGGINGDTVSIIKPYNLDIVISGSYITDSDDYNERLDNLR